MTGVVNQRWNMKDIINHIMGLELHTEYKGESLEGFK